MKTLSKRYPMFCRAIRAPSRRYPMFCRADRFPWASQPRIVEQIASWNSGSEAVRKNKVKGCDEPSRLTTTHTPSFCRQAVGSLVIKDDSISERPR